MVCFYNGYGQTKIIAPDNKPESYYDSIFKLYRDIRMDYGLPDTAYVNNLFFDTTKKGHIKRAYFGNFDIQKKQPIDSTKYYFHKFLYFNSKLKKGISEKAFSRYEDSCAKYYHLLYKDRRNIYKSK